MRGDSYDFIRDVKSTVMKILLLVLYMLPTVFVCLKVGISMCLTYILPEANSSHLRIGRNPHQISGAILVSGRVCVYLEEVGRDIPNFLGWWKVCNQQGILRCMLLPEELVR